MAYTLLNTTIQTLGPAALAHVGALSTILGGGLRGVRVAPVQHSGAEAALYAAIETLLVVGGAGAGRALAGEVVEVLQWRLYGAGTKGGPGGGYAGGALSPPTTKRQKTGRKGRRGGGGGGGPFPGQGGPMFDEAATQRTLHMRASSATPIAAHHVILQRALLRVLAVLFRVAGGVLPAATRLQLDALVCHFACSAERAVQALQGDVQGDVADTVTLFAEACRYFFFFVVAVGGVVGVMCSMYLSYHLNMHLNMHLIINTGHGWHHC